MGTFYIKLLGFCIIYKSLGYLLNHNAICLITLSINQLVHYLKHMLMYVPGIDLDKYICMVLRENQVLIYM